MKKLTSPHLPQNKILNLIILYLVVIIIAISCSKKDSTLQQNTINPKDVDAVKSWVEDQKINQTGANKLWLDSLSKNIDYNSAIEAEVFKGRTMILLPIKIAVNHRIKLQDILDISQNTISYLVLLKREGYPLSGNIIQLENQSVENAFNNSVNIILSTMNFLKGVPQEFSGVMTDLSMTKDLHYQNKYEGGKLKSVGKFQNKPSLDETARRPNTSTSLDAPSCTNWYWVTTYYDGDGNVIDETRRYLYTTCDGGDSGYGGNIGGGSPSTGPDDCNITESNNFNAEVANGSSTSTLDGYEYGSIDGITKYKNPIWQCFKGWGGWHLNSHEVGIVKMLNLSNNSFSWVWKSLTHGSITMEGSVMPGTTVSFSQGIGTPSFTPETAATQKIYSAGMSLSFNVTYTPVCDCKVVSVFLVPVSKDYTANVAFSNANPAEP